MKTIVRKIVSANRVKIPKEIIETLAISKGDSLEIFYEDKKLILKKFTTKIIE